MRLILILVVIGLAAGCSARKPAPAVPIPPVALIDVLPMIRSGCFRCLEEAFATATRQNQPDLAFEAASLLVLRSKELGMPPDVWLQRAAAIAGDDAVWTQMLAMVTAIRPDLLSGDREAMTANPGEITRIRGLIPQWRELLGSADGSPEFRQYLEIALVCGFAPTQQGEAFAAGLAERAGGGVGGGTAPLLEYRAGLCSPTQVDRLRPLAEAGFVDAEYALGRSALDGEKDAEKAMRHFQTAAAAFPTSLSIGTSIGNVYLDWEEWRSAAAAFDSVLAARANHPDALLGRTISVSRLGQYQDGIDTATRLIDGGTWYLGQAHYWRAWNYHGLKNYPQARIDVDRAKTLMFNANVFLLSGLVEWGLERRPTAEAEFAEALRLDFGQCEAAFYLGGVRAEMRKAPEGIAAFKQALQCYDLAIAVRRRLIEGIIGGRGSEPAKARQVASQERAIADNEERKIQAARIIGDLERYLSSLQPPPPVQSPPPSRPVRR
jgi:tetratricopeptide (TPR) repeat protein